MAKFDAGALKRAAAWLQTGLLKGLLATVQPTPAWLRERPGDSSLPPSLPRLRPPGPSP